MVTPISTVGVATVDCDPVSSGCKCGMGVAYRITPHTTKKSHSHGVFL